MKHIELKLPKKEQVLNKPKVTCTSYDEFVDYVEDVMRDGYVIAINKTQKRPPYFIMLDEGGRDEEYDVCLCEPFLIGLEMALFVRYQDNDSLQLLFDDFHIFSVSNKEIVDYFLKN